MNIRISILIVAAALFSGCAVLSCGHSLKIVKAQYGIYDRQIDVTRAVKTLVVDNKILLKAPWALGDVDPAFGSIKSVKITYRYSGTEFTKSFSQEENIALP